MPDKPALPIQSVDDTTVVIRISFIRQLEATTEELFKMIRNHVDTTILLNFDSVIHLRSIVFFVRRAMEECDKHGIRIGFYNMKPDVQAILQRELHAVYRQEACEGMPSAKPDMAHRVFESYEEALRGFPDEKGESNDAAAY